MQDKLQELTDKLYNEGLSKGKKEGEEILSRAKQQGEAIIAEANAGAEKIMSSARKEAESLKTKTESDLKTASAQSMAATRQRIEHLITYSMVSDAVSSTLSSDEFVKEMIRTVAGSFNPTGQDPVDISLILPESMKEKVGPFVEKELSAILGAGVSSEFSKKISGGFKIGPKDGGYFISFTDETFRDLIAEYLRPVTRKLLFGEEK